MDPRADFAGASITHWVRNNPEATRKANETLRLLDERGLLPPVAGFEGTTLEAYRDILGLNGREIRQNDRSGTGLKS